MLQQWQFESFRSRLSEYLEVPTGKRKYQIKDKDNLNYSNILFKKFEARLMKVIRKYEYKLTKSLDKDIEQFIREARKGAYTWDYKYGMEGLRVIKQYFKIVQQEFDRGDLKLCRTCYKLLLTLLFEEGYENSYFGYEDIIDRSKLDFNKIIRNYFLCLIRLHDVNGLFNGYMGYLKTKQDYYFESAEKTIMEELSDGDFHKFKELLSSEAEKIKKDDYEKHDVLNFLLDIAKKKEKDEKKFLDLAGRFFPVLGYSSLKEFLGDYEE